MRNVLEVNCLKLIALFLVSSLSLACAERSSNDDLLALEEKILSLNDEIWDKQQEIIKLLKEHELRDSLSLYRLLFKESPTDIRKSLVHVIMRKVKDEELQIEKDKEVHKLFCDIVDPSKSATHYKLRLADIFYFSEFPNKGMQYVLYDDAHLGLALSEEAKSFYILQSTSMMRYLYLSRWLDLNKPKE